MSDAPTAIDDDFMPDAPLSHLTDGMPEGPTVDIHDAPPRRGRGRPRKNPLSDGATQRPASNGVGRPSGRRVSKDKIRESVVALVAVTNLGIMSVSREDALVEPEMDALSDALTSEVMNSTRLKAWFMASSGVASHLALITVVIAIALPRLARRNLIPQTIMRGLTRESNAYAESSAAASDPESEAEYPSHLPDFAVPVEARGTYGNNGANGVG